MALRRETLIYTPAPPLPAWVTDRMAQIGGLNEFSEPLLRWEWGGTETCWRAGQFRFKYTWGKPELVLAGYFKKQIGTGEVAGYAKPEMSVLTAKEPGILLEPDYQWQAKGHPAWHLAEWFPPELACLDYDKNRYLPDPDTREIVDMLGPIPERGQYRDTDIALEEGMMVGEQHLALIEEIVRERTSQAKGNWRDVRPLEKARQQAMEFGSRADSEQKTEDTERAEFRADLRDTCRFWTKAMFNKSRGWSLPADAKGHK